MKLAREEVCGNSACEHLFFFLYLFVYTYVFTPMLHSYISSLNPYSQLSQWPCSDIYKACVTAILNLFNQT